MLYCSISLIIRLLETFHIDRDLMLSKQMSLVCVISCPNRFICAIVKLALKCRITLLLFMRIRLTLSVRCPIPICCSVSILSITSAYFNPNTNCEVSVVYLKKNLCYLVIFLCYKAIIYLYPLIVKVKRNVTEPFNCCY